MADSPGLDDVPDNASFGATVAWLRRRAGLTGQQLGDRAEMSQAKISRIETGAGSINDREIPQLARALGLSADDAQLLAERAGNNRDRVTDWRPTQFAAADRQHDFAQLEAATREFRVFQNAVVVGLLQTSEYARAVLSRLQFGISTSHIADTAGDISGAVSARLARHAVLEEEHRSFRFVMPESVLRNRLCRPTEMLAQLDRIQEVAGLANVTVSFVPADAPLPIPPFHGFELLDDKCVLVDLVNTTLISHGRDNVRLYQEVFDAWEKAAVTDVEEILEPYYDIYLDESRRERHRG